MSKRPKTKAQEQKITVLFAVGTFLGLSLLALVAWAANRPAPPPAQTFETITAEELKSLVDQGEVTVIDVRAVDQFSTAHIAGSLHIPVSRVEGEIPWLPKDKLIVTYCTCPAEESSGQAAMILAHGGRKAKALKGGLDAWTSLGYATESGVK